MKTRAVVSVEHGKPLVIEELELPDPGPTHVIVKQFATGICHSQIHQIHRADSVRPMVLGHESTGVVVAKGREVTHLKEGDRALLTFVRRAVEEGQPDPAPWPVKYRGRPVRHGDRGATGVFTWADTTIADEQYVVRLPDDDVAMDVTAIVGCAVMTGCGAVIHSAKVRPGDSVAVIGAGGVGLCVLQTAANMGAHPVIAVDLSDDKLAFARRFGATHGVNASQGDPVKAIQARTDGGVDYAIDCIGAARTQEQILYAARPGGIGLKKGGTACLVGAVQELGRIDVEELRITQRTYTGTRGSLCRPDRDFPIFVRWFQRGQLDLDALVTQRYTLEKINDATADLAGGRIHGRSIITYT